MNANTSDAISFLFAGAFHKNPFFFFFRKRGKRIRETNGKNAQLEKNMKGMKGGEKKPGYIIVYGVQYYFTLCKLIFN